MKNFTKGVLLGVGIGLLIAPLSGKETRRLLAERAQEWRNSLPRDSRLNQYISQVSERVSETGENLRGYAEQAVSKAKDTGSSLGYKAMQSSQEMAGKAKQAGQDIAGKARQSSQNLANKARQTAGSVSPRSNADGTHVIPETDD